jgi:hypothetical protein
MLDTLIESPPPRRPRSKPRAWVKCPQTSPLINILYGVPGGHHLRYADSLTPDARRKPADAVAMQLFIALTEHEPAAVEEARFHRNCTKNPVEIEFTEADDGKIATYYGRWVSARGEVGPWSLPTTMRIAI